MVPITHRQPEQEMPRFMIGLAVPFASVLHRWPTFQALSPEEKHQKPESKATAPGTARHPAGEPSPCFPKAASLPRHRLGGNGLVGGHRRSLLEEHGVPLV